MFRRMMTFLCLGALAMSGASLLTAAPAADAEKALKVKDNAPRAADAQLTRALAESRETPQAGLRSGNAPEKNTPVGVIYDNGIVTAIPAASSNCYGNQFDTALGNLIKSFSVTRMSFYMITGVGTDNVFLSIFDNLTAGGNANVVTSVSVPLNNGPGAFNTHTFATPLTGAGSFLAGVWYIGGDTVGLGSGTVGGQGFHGMLINDIVGTGFTTLPGLNALVGASTAFIPVELMDFTVTDE